MNKNEPFRYVSAIVVTAVAGLLDITHKSERTGVQHIVEKVGATIQDHAICGATLTQIQEQARGAKATQVYLRRDPDLPVCGVCAKGYKASPASQWRKFVVS